MKLTDKNARAEGSTAASPAERPPSALEVGRRPPVSPKGRHPVLSAGSIPALTDAERMALHFLTQVESDCIGVVDDEHKFCAAVVFCDLHSKELVSSTPSGDGPVWRINEAGRRVLVANGGRDGE